MKKLCWFLLIMFLPMLYSIIAVIFFLSSLRLPEAIEILFFDFWCITFFVYIFQIAIIIVGLIFRFIKEKQTIKNLLVPYGFIFTLKSYYKDLK